MRLDVTEFRHFYDSPLGAVSRRLLRRRLREIWPDLHGLTVLGLGSLVLAWLTWRGGVRRGWSMAAAVGYAAVYLLDLFEIFPVTPVPMSSLLETLEWLGTALAILLATAVLTAGTRDAGDGRTAVIPRGLTIVMGIAGVGIVIFATIAAMGG